MTALLNAPFSPVLPLASVSGRDLEVPLVQGGTRTYANFDYAASAPALAAVTDRVTNLLPYYASVHRGAGYASRVSTACYESARESVSRFVGATGSGACAATDRATGSGACAATDRATGSGACEATDRPADHVVVFTRKPPTR